MSRSSLSRALVLGLLLFGGSVLSGCFAHVGYDDAYDDDEPPPGYVATISPYYYEGQPVYWWGGNWHYRDHDHWRHYGAEPAPLREFRMHGGPAPGPRFGVPNRPAPQSGGRRSPAPRSYERARPGRR